MCGICGIAGYKGPDAKGVLDVMSSLMRHRGPDQDGVYLDERNGVFFAHRRLSIIDLSIGAKQPMISGDGNIILVFNGEIYNFLELKEELTARGYVFKTHSDTEVILNCYREYGADFAGKLTGMFAMAIYDIKRQRVMLVRDRIGIKPLYYSFVNGMLLFASEIKPLINSGLVQNKVSSQNIKKFLYYRYIPSEDTVIDSIKKLAPGHIILFENGKLSIKRYWKLPDCGRMSFGSSNLRKESEEQFTTLFSKVVKQHLISDVPVGVLLSGGLDSSSVVAAISEHTGEINTFTVGFDEPDDEFRYAEMVSRKYHTNHRNYIFKAIDIKDKLDEIIFSLDEPVADGGAFATYFISQYVRDFVKVILVGEGADESFGGYLWHALGSPYLNFVPDAVRKRFFFYLNTYLPKDLFCQGYKSFSDLLLNDGDKFDAQEIFSFEFEKQLPNNLLMKVDKAAMAHSIEARVPFLDHRVVEFSAKLPVDFRYNILNRKRLLKDAFKEKLPAEIINRKKKGLNMPLHKWLNSELNESVKDIIHDKNAKIWQFLDFGISRFLYEKQTGLKEISRISLLWKILVLERWLCLHNI